MQVIDEKTWDAFTVSGAPPPPPEEKPFPWLIVTIAGVVTVSVIIYTTKRR